MAEKVKLVEFEFDTAAINAASEANAQLKKSIIELRAEQAKTNKEIKVSGKVTDEQAKSLSENDVALKNLNKSYAQNTKVIQANAASTKALNTELNREVKSEQDALNNIQKLTQARKGLDVTTAKGQKSLEKINAKIDQNNKFITENSDAYTKQKRNVGNYTESIQQALGAQGMFNGEMQQFKGVVTAFSPVFATLKNQVVATKTQYTEATAATKGLSVAQRVGTAVTAGATAGLKLFRIALISTGVGALVVALGSLITFLATTQKGIDAVTSVTRPLAAVFSRLVGLAQELGESLFESLKNPKQAIIDLGKLILDNLINRFTAFAVIAEGIINLDFEKVANGVIQVGTGIEDTIGKAKDLGGVLSDAAKEGIEIDRIIKERKKLETTIASRQAGLNKQLEEQQTILADTALSGEKRVAAADEAERIQKQIIENENEIVQLNIEALILKQKQNDTTREDLQVLDALQAKLIENQATLDKQEKKGIAARKTLADEARKAEEKRVNDAISKQKELLALFEATSGLEGVAQAEALKDKRVEILDAELEAKKISQEAYDLALINLTKQTNDEIAQIGIDNLQNELDAFEFNNQSKIDANTLLNEALIMNEEERIDTIAAKEVELAQEQLGNTLEFEIAKAQIEEDADKQKLENRALLDQQERDRKAIDLANDIELQRLSGESALQLRIEELERKRLIEVEAAEKANADVEKVNEKFRKQTEKLEDISNQNKEDASLRAAQNLTSAFKSAGIESKGVSSALALVDTFLAANAALASGSKISPFVGFASSAAAVVSGLANVAKINAIQFDEGGLVPELSSGRISVASNIPTQSGGDNILATVKSGEVILNKRQQAALGGAQTFRSIGVRGFADGGLVGVPSSVTNSVTSASITREEAIELARSVVMSMRVVNVARDTFDIAGDEIRVENNAVI